MDLNIELYGFHTQPRVVYYFIKLEFEDVLG